MRRQNQQNELGENQEMLRIGRLAGALTALGLAIAITPASAFWNLVGGGGGGDSIWSPFDTRFQVIEGSMKFVQTVELDSNVALGNIEIVITAADAFAYNTIGRNALNNVPDGTPYGPHSFNFTFFNATQTTNLLESGEVEYVLSVRSNNGEGIPDGFGEGFLEYLEVTLDTEVLQPGNNQTQVRRDSRERLSIDEEFPGKIAFRTADCVALERDTGVSCPDSFFNWRGTAEAGAQSGFTPVDGDGFNVPIDPEDFTTIDVTTTLSLFHAGQLCEGLTPGDQPTPEQLLDAFYCNPTQGTFEASGLDGTFGAYMVARPGAINVDAAIPVPPMAALLSVGLAGIGFASRRNTR